MRIVGGKWRGRSLKGPATQDIRPTSDRLRESLFNILLHGYGNPVANARVMDVFAGTGALALEALSRGARFALLVDDGAEARALIRENVEALGAGGQTRIFRRDARKLADAPTGEIFSLVFLDPPYGNGLAEPVLQVLGNGQWLAPGALLVVEEAANVKLDIPSGFELAERREVGETALWFLRAAG